MQYEQSINLWRKIHVTRHTVELSALSLAMVAFTAIKAQLSPLNKILAKGRRTTRKTMLWAIATMKTRRPRSPCHAYLSVIVSDLGVFCLYLEMSSSSSSEVPKTSGEKGKVERVLGCECTVVVVMCVCVCVCVCVCCLLYTSDAADES